MNDIRKILFVEFSTSHSETLYSQLSLFENSNVEVHLFINKRLKFNNTFSFIKKIIQTENESFFKKYIFIFKLLRYILNHRITDVIINTAEGLQTRDFILISLPFNFSIIGLLHNASKYTNSITQKIISLKIKKYIVLSDFIQKNLKVKPVHKFISLYTIDYRNITLQVNTKKDFVVLIPGEISPKRRSYFKLIELLKSNDNLPDKIKFELLGRVRINDGNKVIQEIYKNNLQNRFILYNEYIPENIYSERCANASLILPLIFNDTVNFQNYINYQISGSYSISYTYHIPMLMDNAFAEFEEFKEISFFCDPNNVLESIIYIYNNHQKLIDKRMIFENLRFIRYEYQKEKYLKFIGLS